MKRSEVFGKFVDTHGLAGDGCAEPISSQKPCKNTISPSCRDEKEREKDEVADDDGCACVYVGLGP